MTPALIFALSLMATDAQPAPGDGGEPLPPGAPTESYELAAWCYGALGEYLAIYDHVKPDLRDMDRMFGTSVVEDQPYQSDMAAYRVELKMIGDSVTDAEKASDRPIAERGATAMHLGENIWSYAEAKTRRELARAWLMWALPDACDSNARELTSKSLLLGRALKFNTNSPAPAPLPDPVSPALAAANAAAAADASSDAASAPLRDAPPGADYAAPPSRPAAPYEPTQAASAPPAQSPGPANEPPVSQPPAASAIAASPPEAAPAQAEAAAPTEAGAPSSDLAVAPPPEAQAAPAQTPPAPAASPPPPTPTSADQAQEPTL